TAMSRMYAALDTLPMPLIGRIHGAALGGGAGLAAVCDIVVADEGALFGFTATRLGILPAGISAVALAEMRRSAAGGRSRTAARLSAARARESGRVRRVVPAAELDSTVDGFVKEIMTAGPEAIAAAKALIPQVWPLTAADAADLTARAIAARRVSPEG